MPAGGARVLFTLGPGRYVHVDAGARKKILDPMCWDHEDYLRGREELTASPRNRKAVEIAVVHVV